MKCKKCGKDLDRFYYLRCHLPTNEEDIPENLFEMLCGDVSETPSDKDSDYYFNYYCDNCHEPIPFMDMTSEMFCHWLKITNDLVGDPTLRGKALIKYFGLDKLLGKERD